MSDVRIRKAAKAWPHLALGAALLLGSVGTAAAQESDKAVLSRGKYIVERVGMCADCHTPHDQKGQLVKAKMLQGSELGMKPLHPMPWADTAPPIAGLPAGWTDAEMVKFLEAGIRPNGEPPRPPMPPYRLSHRDAVAATAYIKSLPH
jgi:mono/diheme cytochrome c family protein